MLDQKDLKVSAPKNAAFMLLNAEDQIIAAGQAIQVVLTTMKYAHHEPDRWETNRLQESMDSLQGGYPVAAIIALDRAMEPHLDRSRVHTRTDASTPIDTLIKRLDTIYRLQA